MYVCCKAYYMTCDSDFQLLLNNKTFVQNKTDCFIQSSILISLI